MEYLYDDEIVDLPLQLGRVPIYLTYPIYRSYFAIKARLDELGIAYPIFDPLNGDEMSAVVKELLRLSEK